MTDPEKTVFISYRRSTSYYLAQAIFDDLRAHDYDVFFDVTSIDSGTFDTIILNQIKARAHFIVLLSPGALEGCKNPDDWLRREIETAMEYQRNVVPLLDGDFRFQDVMPYLTGRLAELPRYNALPLPRYKAYFQPAMEELRARFLKQSFYGTITPTPADEQAVVQQKIEEAARQPTPTEQQLSVEEYFNQGNALYSNGHYDGAIKEYNEAIRLNPQYANAYNNRASARKAKGDLDGAISDYGEAIRLNPQVTYAYINRASARKAKGDLDGAISDYGEAIRLNPQSVFAYGQRAAAREMKGDYDGAISDYDEAIRLNPQDAAAYYNRGVARADRSDLDGAISDYNEALRLNPQAAAAYYNRGVARADRSDLDGAISDYNEALRLNPLHAEAYYDRGSARANKGDIAGAIADYQKYLDLGGGQWYGDQEATEKRIADLKKKLM